jgi:outer membrane protein
MKKSGETMSMSLFTKSVLAACSVATIAVGVSARAADLPSAKAPPIPFAAEPEDYQRFFVRLGFTYALNTSTSHLSAQSPALLPGNTTYFPAGVGATIGNLATVGFEAGYYVTRNISLNISAGVPYYVKDSTKGFNPLNPVLVNGTTLGQIVPAVVPITVVYHFNGFGKLQPYAGVGIAPGFVLGTKNAFLNNITVDPSVALVLQGGADYMIDRHWGVSFDVKKLFSYVTAESTGMNIPGLGAVPAGAQQNVRFQPWLFSTGIVYRFGAPEQQTVVAKY